MDRTKTGGMYLAVAIAAVCALVLSVSRAAAVETAYPVERARRTFAQKVWTRISGFFAGASARAENVRLKREVASLAVLRGDVERLETENARLRRALDYASRKSAAWMPAGVLSVGGGAAGSGDTLRVDKGTLAGVKKGAVVVVPEGLVGRVSSVTPHTAEIALVTDRSVKVACEIECVAGGRVRGIIAGGSEESLHLWYLSGTAEVPPRSRVMTSGLGGVFPRGIEIGTVLEIKRDGQGFACEGEVLPSVDYTVLEDVFIRCGQ